MINLHEVLASPLVLEPRGRADCEARAERGPLGSKRTVESTRPKLKGCRQPHRSMPYIHYQQSPSLDFNGRIFV